MRSQSVSVGTAEELAPPGGVDPAAVPTRDTEYDHLVPLLHEHAALPTPDPRRRRLRDQLVTGYLPVAQHIAQRFANRGEPLDDLIQVATVGLIAAVDRFQPDLGHSFLSFAVPTIRGEIRRHFRDRGWSMRVPRRLKDMHVAINAAVAELSHQLGRAPRPSDIARLLDVPLEDVVTGLAAAHAYRATSLDEQLPSNDGDASGGSLGDQLGALDPAIEFVEDQNALRPLLARLAERERTILLLRFYGNMTQTEIAERIGISQMHVSRLLSQTLSWLRGQLH
jgi:RNA polymerase sigma-B factor